MKFFTDAKMLNYLFKFQQFLEILRQEFVILKFH